MVPTTILRPGSIFTDARLVEVSISPGISALMAMTPWGMEIRARTSRFAALMSEIARSLQEEILAKKTQERLERHLATDGMDAKIHGSILCDAAPGDRKSVV